MPACTSCGNEIPDGNTAFCPKCGAQVLLAGTYSPASANPSLPGAVVTPSTSGLAIVSLICGVLSFVFPFAIAAIIFGHISRSDIHRSGGRKTGGGMALAGLILGYLGVAIIPLIIAAIAIPNLLRAKIEANEASAVGSLRILNTSAVVYANKYGDFPPSIAALGPSPTPSATAADLVDSALASGAKHGYAFTYSKYMDPTNKTGAGKYTITASPVAPGSTGQRYFFTDETGTIRLETDRVATADSPPIN